MPSEDKTFTLITAHFGNLFWIRNLAERIVALSPAGAIHEFRIVDQDRSAETARILAALPGRPMVISFPKDEEEIARVGHDHATTLNRCMKLEYATSHVILLDSDCFPIEPDWIDRIRSRLKAGYDAIVASEFSSDGLSHPCFMVLPIAVLRRLDFAEGFIEEGIDTGRLVGSQLQRLGYRVHWEGTTKAFSRRRGFFYLDRSLYHHSNASFVSSPQQILQSQVNLRVEEFFRRKVARGEFSLSALEQVRLAILKRWAKMSSHG